MRRIRSTLASQSTPSTSFVSTRCHEGAGNSALINRSSHELFFLCENEKGCVLCVTPLDIRIQDDLNDLFEIVCAGVDDEVVVFGVVVG